MKIGLFLLKFPLSFETFVFNQITAFIDTGYDVEIVALQKGDLENTHASFNTYRLGEKTHWLLNESGSKLAKPKYRAATALHDLARAVTWKTLNVARYGEEACNLILAAICGGSPQAFQAGIFIAHSGSTGVTAARLRELGMICEEIATVFRGVDVSHRDMFAHYIPEYQQLFQRGDLILFIGNLWAGRLKNMGCPPQKIVVSCMGINTTCLNPRQLKVPAAPLGVTSVARLVKKERLYVAIEVCRQLKEQGILFRYRILGIGP